MVNNVAYHCLLKDGRKILLINKRNKEIQIQLSASAKDSSISYVDIITNEKMAGMQFDRIISISISQGMDCDMILDDRENIDLPFGSEIAEKGKKAYKLPVEKNVKLHLKYL